MSASPDPLLRATRLLLRLTMGLVAVGGVALAIAAPFVWAFSGRIVTAAADQGMVLTARDAALALSVLIVAGLILLALSFQFLRKLVAIIDSVGEGSPFIPENAARLRAMGWMALAFQGWSLLAVPAEIWLARIVPRMPVQIHFTLFGVIVALLLFILARVFDRGVQLEQDVEGTV